MPPSLLWNFTQSLSASYGGTTYTFQPFRPDGSLIQDSRGLHIVNYDSLPYVDLREFFVENASFTLRVKFQEDQSDLSKSANYLTFGYHKAGFLGDSVMIRRNANDSNLTLGLVGKIRQDEAPYSFNINIINNLHEVSFVYDNLKYNELKTILYDGSGGTTNLGKIAVGDFTDACVNITDAFLFFGTSAWMNEVSWGGMFDLAKMTIRELEITISQAVIPASVLTTTVVNRTILNSDNNSLRYCINGSNLKLSFQCGTQFFGLVRAFLTDAAGTERIEFAIYTGDGIFYDAYCTLSNTLIPAGILYYKIKMDSTIVQGTFDTFVYASSPPTSASIQVTYSAKHTLYGKITNIQDEVFKTLHANIPNNNVITYPYTVKIDAVNTLVTPRTIDGTATIIVYMESSSGNIYQSPPWTIAGLQDLTIYDISYNITSPSTQNYHNNTITSGAQFTNTLDDTIMITETLNVVSGSYQDANGYPCIQVTNFASKDTNSDYTRYVVAFSSSLGFTPTETQIETFITNIADISNILIGDASANVVITLSITNKILTRYYTDLSSTSSQGYIQAGTQYQVYSIIRDYPRDGNGNLINQSNYAISSAKSITVRNDISSIDISSNRVDGRWAYADDGNLVSLRFQTFYKLRSAFEIRQLSIMAYDVSSQIIALSAATLSSTNTFTVYYNVSSNIPSTDGVYGYKINYMGNSISSSSGITIDRLPPTMNTVTITGSDITATTLTININNFADAYNFSADKNKIQLFVAKSSNPTVFDANTTIMSANSATPISYTFTSLQESTDFKVTITLTDVFGNTQTQYAYATTSTVYPRFINSAFNTAERVNTSDQNKLVYDVSGYVVDDHSSYTAYAFLLDSSAGVTKDGTGSYTGASNTLFYNLIQNNMSGSAVDKAVTNGVAGVTSYFSVTLNKSYTNTSSVGSNSILYAAKNYEAVVVIIDTRNNISARSYTVNTVTTSNVLIPTVDISSTHTSYPTYATSVTNDVITLQWTTKYFEPDTLRMELTNNGTGNTIFASNAITRLTGTTYRVQSNVTGSSTQGIVPFLITLTGTSTTSRTTSTNSSSVIVDLTSPTYSIVIDPSFQRVSFTVSSLTDNNSPGLTPVPVLDVSLNTGATIQVTANGTYTFTGLVESTNYTLYRKVTDALGNSASTSSGFTTSTSYPLLTINTVTPTYRLDTSGLAYDVNVSFYDPHSISQLYVAFFSTVDPAASTLDPCGSLLPVISTNVGFTNSMLTTKITQSYVSSSTLASPSNLLVGQTYYLWAYVVDGRRNITRLQYASNPLSVAYTVSNVSMDVSGAAAGFTTYAKGSDLLRTFWTTPYAETASRFSTVTVNSTDVKTSVVATNAQNTNWIATYPVPASGVDVSGVAFTLAYNSTTVQNATQPNSVYIDRTAPTYTLTATVLDSSRINVTLSNFADTGSVVKAKNMTYTISALRNQTGPVDATASGTLSNPSYTFTPVILTGLQESTPYLITTRVTDSLGYFTDATAVRNTLDQTPPQIISYISPYKSNDVNRNFTIDVCGQSVDTYNSYTTYVAAFDTVSNGAWLDGASNFTASGITAFKSFVSGQNTSPYLYKVTQATKNVTTNFYTRLTRSFSDVCGNATNTSLLVGSTYKILVYVEDICGNAIGQSKTLLEPAAISTIDISSNFTNTYLCTSGHVISMKWTTPYNEPISRFSTITIDSTDVKSAATVLGVQGSSVAYRVTYNVPNRSSGTYDASFNVTYLTVTNDHSTYAGTKVKIDYDPPTFTSIINAPTRSPTIIIPVAISTFTDIGTSTRAKLSFTLWAYRFGTQIIDASLSQTNIAQITTNTIYNMTGGTLSNSYSYTIRATYTDEVGIARLIDVPGGTVILDNVPPSATYTNGYPVFHSTLLRILAQGTTIDTYSPYNAWIAAFTVDPTSMTFGSAFQTASITTQIATVANTTSANTAKAFDVSFNSAFTSTTVATSTAAIALNTNYYIAIYVADNASNAAIYTQPVSALTNAITLVDISSNRAGYLKNATINDRVTLSYTTKYPESSTSNFTSQFLTNQGTPVTGTVGGSSYNWNSYFEVSSTSIEGDVNLLVNFAWAANTFANSKYISFVGVGYLEVSNTGIFSSNTVTVSAWYYANSSGHAWGAVVDLGAFSVANGGMVISRNGSNAPNGMRIGRGGDYLYTSPTNQWNHVVYSLNGGILTNAYLNGVVLSTSSNNFGTKVGTILRVACLVEGYGDNFTGFVDEVAIWDTALSTGVMSTFYNGGIPTNVSSYNPKAYWRFETSHVSGNQILDQSAYGNHLTYYSGNGTQGSPSGVLGNTSGNMIVSSSQTYTSTKTLSLASASSQYATTSNTNVSFANNFTWSCWVNMPSTAIRMALLSVYNSGNSYYRQIEINTSNQGKLYLYTNNTSLTVASSSINFSAWNHIAVVLQADGTTATVYLNGSVTLSGSIVNTTINSNFVIGRRANIADTDYLYYNGKIDEVAIFNIPFTPAQVTELYSQGAPTYLLSHSMAGNLKAWWTFEDAYVIGASVTDRSGNSNTLSLVNGPTTTTTGFASTTYGSVTQKTHTNLSTSNVVLDRTAPTVSTPVVQSRNTNSIVLRVDASDNYTNISSVTVQARKTGQTVIDASFVATGINNTTYSNTAITLSPLADNQQYDISLVVVDVISNSATYAYSALTNAKTFDGTPPDVTSLNFNASKHASILRIDVNGIATDTQNTMPVYVYVNLFTSDPSAYYADVGGKLNSAGVTAFNTFKTNRALTFDVNGIPSGSIGNYQVTFGIPTAIQETTTYVNLTTYSAPTSIMAGVPYYVGVLVQDTCGNSFARFIPSPYTLNATLSNVTCTTNNSLINVYAKTGDIITVSWNTQYPESDKTRFSVAFGALYTVTGGSILGSGTSFSATYTVIAGTDRRITPTVTYVGTTVNANNTITISTTSPTLTYDIGARTKNIIMLQNFVMTDLDITPASTDIPGYQLVFDIIGGAYVTYGNSQTKTYNNVVKKANGSIVNGSSSGVTAYYYVTTDSNNNIYLNGATNMSLNLVTTTAYVFVGGANAGTPITFQNVTITTEYTVSDSAGDRTVTFLVKKSGITYKINSLPASSPPTITLYNSTDERPLEPFFYSLAEYTTYQIRASVRDPAGNITSNITPSAGGTSVKTLDQSSPVISSVTVTPDLSNKTFSVTGTIAESYTTPWYISVFALPIASTLTTAQLQLDMSNNLVFGPGSISGKYGTAGVRRYDISGVTSSYTFTTSPVLTTDVCGNTLVDGSYNVYVVAKDSESPPNTTVSSTPSVLFTAPVILTNTNSLYFDGITAYAQNTAFTTNYYQAHTMTMWINIDTMPSYRSYLYDLKGAGSTNFRGVTLVNGTTMHVNASNVGIVFNPNITTNTWYHFAFVYLNSTTFNVYKNGSLLQSITTSFEQTVPTAPATITMMRNGDDPDTFSSVKCYIDEVAFFNTGLDANNVQTIYNNGNPMFLMSNRGNYNKSSNLVSWWRMEAITSNTVVNTANSGTYDLSLVNGPSLYTSVPSVAFTNTNSLRLQSGSSQYAYTGWSTISTGVQRTISMWLYAITPTATSIQYPAISWNVGDTELFVQKQTDSYNNTLRVFLRTSGGSGYATYNLPGGNSWWDQWHHVAFYIDTLTNNYPAVYMDGTLLSTAGGADTLVRTDTTLGSGSNNTTYIGYYPTGNTYWVGYIDEVSIFTGLLTQPHITALYNGGVPGNLEAHPAYTSNLISWWRFEGNGNDSKGLNNLTLVNGNSQSYSTSIAPTSATASTPSGAYTVRLPETLSSSYYSGNTETRMACLIDNTLKSVYYVHETTGNQQKLYVQQPPYTSLYKSVALHTYTNDRPVGLSVLMSNGDLVYHTISGGGNVDWRTILYKYEDYTTNFSTSNRANYGNQPAGDMITSSIGLTGMGDIVVYGVYLNTTNRYSGLIARVNATRTGFSSDVQNLGYHIGNTNTTPFLPSIKNTGNSAVSSCLIAQNPTNNGFVMVYVNTSNYPHIAKYTYGGSTYSQSTNYQLMSATVSFPSQLDDMTQNAGVHVFPDGAVLFMYKQFRIVYNSSDQVSSAQSDTGITNTYFGSYKGYAIVRMGDSSIRAVNSSLQEVANFGQMSTLKYAYYNSTMNKLIFVDGNGFVIKENVGYDVFANNKFISFNGSSSQFASINNSAIILSNTCTFALWVNSNYTGPKDMVLFQQGTNVTNYTCRSMYFSGGSGGSLSYNAGDSGNFPYLSGTGWNHYVVVNGGTFWNGYKNGVLSWTRSNPNTTAVNDQTLYIAKPALPNDHDWYNGSIDEFAIWSTALDANNVAAIYNNGTPISLTSNSGNYTSKSSLQAWWRFEFLNGNDESGNGRHLTLSNTPMISTYSLSSTGTATGGTISYANGLKVHSFTSTGTFTVTSGSIPSVTYLVVGGGGGGGYVGGGGGAGGIIYAIGQTIAPGTYTITVGNGGNGGGMLSVGNNGGNSSFNGQTGIGGGGGGYFGGSINNGYNGGCGGGGAYGSGVGGSGSQGYGGAGTASSPNRGGGGGGMGAAGTTGNPPHGGVGVSYSLVGSAKWYSGGGGGGSDAVGGNNGNLANDSNAGGRGGNGDAGGGPSSGTSGASNTGNGGGGGGGNGGGLSGGNGGSGIVIICYQESAGGLRSTIAPTLASYTITPGAVKLIVALSTYDTDYSATAYNVVVFAVASSSTYNTFSPYITTSTTNTYSYQGNSASAAAPHSQSVTVTKVIGGTSFATGTNYYVYVVLYDANDNNNRAVSATGLGPYQVQAASTISAFTVSVGSFTATGMNLQILTVTDTLYANTSVLPSYTVTSVRFVASGGAETTVSFSIGSHSATSNGTVTMSAQTITGLTQNTQYTAVKMVITNQYGVSADLATSISATTLDTIAPTVTGVAVTPGGSSIDVLMSTYDTGLTTSQYFVVTFLATTPTYDTTGITTSTPSTNTYTGTAKTSSSPDTRTITLSNTITASSLTATTNYYVYIVVYDPNGNSNRSSSVVGNGQYNLVAANTVYIFNVNQKQVGDLIEMTEVQAEGYTIESSYIANLKNFDSVSGSFPDLLLNGSESENGGVVKWGDTANNNIISITFPTNVTVTHFRFGFHRLDYAPGWKIFRNGVVVYTGGNAGTGGEGVWVDYYL